MRYEERFLIFFKHLEIIVNPKWRRAKELRAVIVRWGNAIAIMVT